jgi:hypothetical protein
MDTSSATMLKILDWVLRIATAALVVGTALFVVLVPVVATGHGEVTLPARLDPPFAVELPSEAAILVDGNGRPSVYEGFPIGDEKEFLNDRLAVATKVTVDDDDADTRAAAMITVVAFFGLTWLGLVNLRRIVQSARAGDPFNRANPGRLRWLAAAVVASGVAVRVAIGVMDARLDEHLPVQLASPGPGLIAYLLVGLGLLALAEIFRSGSELRDFEQATI